MIADWFGLDGQHVQTGSQCPVTKSIYRAAVDAAEQFGGVVMMVNFRLKWAVIGVGQKRLVIGEI